MKIKIFTIVTESYKEIFNEFFINRVPKSFDNISVNYLLNDDATPGNVGSTEFKLISFYKMKLIHHSIKSNMGDVILFCDTDIVFLSDFYSDLLGRMTDHDMLFQDNLYDNGYNLGFFTIKCSEKTLKFWELIMANYNENHKIDFNEQQVINKLIHDTDIIHGYLPIEYYCNPLPIDIKNESRYGYSIENIVDGIPNNAYLCHCTSVDGG